MEVVCNKDGMGGGDFTKTPATPAGRTIRRINAGRTSGTKGSVDIRKFVLGTRATSDVLQARAIPDGKSPKRQTPMEVDTPGKKLCLREPGETIVSSPLLRKKPGPKNKASRMGGKINSLRRLAQGRILFRNSHPLGGGNEIKGGEGFQKKGKERRRRGGRGGKKGKERRGKGKGRGEGRGQGEGEDKWPRGWEAAKRKGSSQGGGKRPRGREAA